MPILWGTGAQAEIRLRKPPFDPENQVYFDDREIPKDKITRYIVPEDTTYAIQITLKKGFNDGKYDRGFSIRIYDKGSEASVDPRDDVFR